MAFDEPGHLEPCDDCQAVHEAAKHARMLLLPDGLPSEAVWEGVQARIATDAARQDLRVVLGCTFCHDRLRRAEAVYCATCLAPHHEDCFGEHGRCSTPGCGDTQVVRSQAGPAPRRAAKAPSPAMRPLMALIGGVVAMLLASFLVLALSFEGGDTRAGSEGRSAPTPAPAESTMVVVTTTQLAQGIYLHQGGLLTVELEEAAGAEVLAAIHGGWEVHYPSQPVSYPEGLTGVVTLHAERADVRYVLGEIAGQLGCALEDRSGELVLSPWVTGDAERVRIQAEDVEDVHWLQILHAIVSTTGHLAVVEEGDGLLRIVPAESIEQQLVTEAFQLEHVLSPIDAQALLPQLRQLAGVGRGLDDAMVTYLPDRQLLVAHTTKPALRLLNAVIDKVGSALEIGDRRPPGLARVVPWPGESTAQRQAVIAWVEERLPPPPLGVLIHGEGDQLVLFGSEADLEAAVREIEAWKRAQGE
jgi:hypothetical protein